MLDAGRQSFGRANGVPMLNPEAAARFAMNAPLPGESEYVDGLVDEFEHLKSDGKGKEPLWADFYASEQPRAMTEFDRIYETFQGDRGAPFQSPDFAHPGAEQALPVLQAFIHDDQGILHHAKMSQAHASGAIPELNIPDKCRVRDRSTILARQMFADRGQAYIDQHVETLMDSLRIDAASLPASLLEAGSSWEQIYHNNNVNSVASDHAIGQQARVENGEWAEEFSKMNLQDSSTEVWANEYASAKSEWVDEFSKENTTQSALDRDRSLQSNSALEHTRKLAETLSAEKDPKFKNSKFLQFVSKMSRGELMMDGNAVKEVPKTSLDWSNEFSEEQRGQHELQRNGDLDAHFTVQAKGGDWAEEFASQMASGGQWAEEFAEGKFADSATIENWEDEYLSELEKLHNGFPSDGGYKMAANNPFLLDTNSFEKGRDLFRRGLLSEAVFAIEAECQRHPGNTEAWKLLGTVQAENDDDIQAINALNKALACDSNNLEVLLSLGVSYTNELDQKRALEYLRQWLGKHPLHSTVMQNTSGPPDSSQNLSFTIRLFQEAAAASPQDADVYAALGVLLNLARRYGDAVDAFRTALSLNSNDYSLWNKLGATLANSSRSGEAIDAYRRALEQKPNYMRAWTNMGISLSNLGKYEESARYYIRALSLNTDAGSVWGYLRTSLICGDREDIIDLVDKQDIVSLQKALPL